MKWFLCFTLIAASLTLAPVAAAAPKLPACTPVQIASWPITDRNTIVEGRTVEVHTSPDGSKRCGTVKVSERTPSQAAPRPTKGKARR